MKVKKTAKFWLCISLCICLISMVGAYVIQTSSGTVIVKDMRWETPSGHLMSALLFVPKTATAENPAPAIVTSHGWYNNREMQDLNFVEYSRRGYVVVSIDMYGHGNSETISSSLWQQNGTGMYDAVKLVADLPYVDKAHIGITGHSNGARAANWSIDEDNLAENPLVSTVLLVANDATYKDPDGNFFNKYGTRNVGIVAAQYDEFFFRVKDENGKSSPPREYINQVTAQSFLHFGKDPAGSESRNAYTIYNEPIDGQNAMRVIYTPNEIHPWNHFSTGVVVSSLEFFQNAMPAPNPIPPVNQVWLWKVFFNTLGLIGIAIFLVSFTKVILATAYFGSLRAKEEVKPLPAPMGNSRIWLWVSLGLGVIFSIYTYVSLFMWSNKVRPVNFFTQSPTFYIGVWSVVNGLFILACLLVGYYLFGGKHTSISMKERGVIISGQALLKTILLSLLVVASAFGIVFLADYLFKVDFRIWVIPMKAFTADKFSIILRYLPFFLIYYVINSVAINSFNFVQMGKKDWMNIAVLALFNGLSSIIMIVWWYSYFFATGLGYTEVNLGVSNIIGIWIMPVAIFLPLAALFTRSIYKVTRNPYLGSLIFALLITIISCTNTLTQLPPIA